MRALDVNVLVALLDRDHVDHCRARAWISTEIHLGWASCAVTQNGFIRVISQLAVERGGRFVTFDRSVPTSAALGAGPRHLLVL